MAPVDYSNIPSKTHHTHTQKCFRKALNGMEGNLMAVQDMRSWLTTVTRMTHSLKCRLKLVVSCYCNFPRLYIHHALYGRFCPVEQDAKDYGPFIGGELPSLQPDPGSAKGFELFRQIPLPHFPCGRRSFANYSNRNPHQIPYRLLLYREHCFVKNSPQSLCFARAGKTSCGIAQVRFSRRRAVNQYLLLCVCLFLTGLPVRFPRR